jgi:glycosyltransferase involved in cell wall biosynthesis
MARIHAENLRSLGAEVMLVTSDLHFESDQARPYETVLLGRPIPWAGWLPWLAAYRDAKRFQPDVIVTEMLRDPRWRLLGRLAPRIRIVHDDKPHDHTHVAPWWNRFFFDRWDEKAAATIVFSNYVAESLRAQGRADSPLYVAPLVSDLDPALVPDFVPAERRKNFLLVGRQKPYKNHDVVFAAWEAHTRGSAWQGDELILLGGGDILGPLPAHARWNQAEFQYRQIVDELARAKGSIAHCRSASQSGVQVLAMQLGVPTLVSNAGGLPEYQPPGSSVTGIDDVDGLSRALDALAQPEEAVLQGQAAQEHYRNHYDSPIVARRLLEILRDVGDQT